MPGKKQLFANLLDRIGLLDLWPRASSTSVVVLAYHRVFDMGPEDRFACDPELVSASPADFRMQMKLLREQWHPISLDEVIDAAEAGRSLPARSVVVTFDDGHVDNYRVAFPILREFNIPATIFLATGYIGTQAQFWFDRVPSLLFVAPTGSHRVAPLASPLQLGDVASRRAASDQLLAALKQLPDAARRDCVAALEAQFGASLQGRDLPVGNMTWDQVRDMAAQRVVFGSHTVSHPILSKLEPADLRRELADSRAAIERETGLPCQLLAYPVGKPYAYNEQVIAVARDCGYRAALSYIDGVNDLQRVERFAFRRIAVERYYSHAMFKARMLIPQVFL